MCRRLQSPVTLDYFIYHLNLRCLNYDSLGVVNKIAIPGLVNLIATKIAGKSITRIW